MKKITLTFGPTPVDLVKRHYFPDLSYFNDEYNFIFNVSDTIGQTLHLKNCLWFPIEELGDWGYTPFYGIISTIQDCCKGRTFWNLNIYIHCHAGVNRSMCVAMILANVLKIDYKDIKSFGADISELSKDLLARNFQRGYIPDDIYVFLEACVKFPTYSLGGIQKQIA